MVVLWRRSYLFYVEYLEGGEKVPSLQSRRMGRDVTTGSI